jgi:mRNA interferase HicA
MKRTDLLKQINSLAASLGGTWRFHREGANHEVWKANGKSIPIPRHREVNDYTAAQILKQVEEALE